MSHEVKYKIYLLFKTQINWDKQKFIYMYYFFFFFIKGLFIF